MGRFLVMPLLSMVWSTPWLHPVSLLPSSLFSATWGREGHRGEIGGGALGTKWGWKVSGRQVGQGIVDAVKELVFFLRTWETIDSILKAGSDKMRFPLAWRRVSVISRMTPKPPASVVTEMAAWLWPPWGQKSRDPYAVQPPREFRSGNSKPVGFHSRVTAKDSVQNGLEEALCL